MRDPEVVEGPTRPICPPSDPVSCLPHPRDVVPAPLPYQDITHRTRNRLTTPLRVAGELPSPLLCMWVLFSGSPGRHPTGGGGIDLYVRRFARDALSARLDRSVVVLLSSRRGCGLAAAVRGDSTSSSPPSPLPLPLPLKLLRRHHRARARGAAWRHAAGGYFVDRDRGSDRDRRRRAATSGGVVAAPRDAAQLRETEVAAGWRPRRGGVVAPRCVLLWR